MPRHMDPSKRDYVVRFYPVDPPANLDQWQLWPSYSVCIPGPLIPYLLNVMRPYQWLGRVKTDDPAIARLFVSAWNDLIAQIASSEECMPYPLLRQNPANPCQTQQSLDGGSTWTVVFDSSACLPTIPPMIRLRQNPANPAILQQSFDGGSTWTTAYDNSLYRPRMSIVDETTIYNNRTEILNQYNTDNQTIVNIAPQIIYGGANSGADIDKIICAALAYFVKMTISALITAKKSDYANTVIDPSSKAGAILAGTGGAAAGAVAVGFIAPPIGIALGAASAIGALFAVIAPSLVPVDLSLFEDNEAIQAVYCCLIDALSGQQITRARFVSAASCPDLTGNAATLAGLFSTYMADLNVYLQFAAYAQSLAEVNQVAELPDCPCTTAEPRVPVINSLWDPTRTAGTITGPDSNGFYLATSANRTSDEAITLMDEMGRDFILTDVSYDVIPSCQVFLLDEAILYIGCTGSNHYSGQLIDEFSATWAVGYGTQQMQFKMIAP